MPRFRFLPTGHVPPPTEARAATAVASLNAASCGLSIIVAASGRRIRYIDEDQEVGDTATYGTVLLEKRR